MTPTPDIDALVEEVQDDLAISKRDGFPSFIIRYSDLTAILDDRDRLKAENARLREALQWERTKPQREAALERNLVEFHRSVHEFKRLLHETTDDDGAKGAKP